MTKSTGRFIAFILAGIFAISFLLPTLQGPMGVKLNGLTTFGLHLATIALIENVYDYFLFLFTALTNLWVVILLIWLFRNKVKLLPSILLGILALSSAFSWKFNMIDSGVLLIGYWIWIMSIIFISGFAIYRALKKIQY